jgi:hypothetical protein
MEMAFLLMTWQLCRVHTHASHWIRPTVGAAGQCYRLQHSTAWSTVLLNTHTAAGPTPQAAIGSQLMSVAGVFSHLPHSIDTLTAMSTVRCRPHVASPVNKTELHVLQAASLVSSPVSTAFY